MVGSHTGSYVPTRIIGDLFLVDSSGKTVPVEENILDGGSALTLMGESDFKKYHAAGVMRKAVKRTTSITKVFGIGAANIVLYHATFTLRFGGADIEFLDVPVLANHRGLLLGNDLLFEFQAGTQLRKNLPHCDGHVCLHDQAYRQITRPVPVITTSRPPRRVISPPSPQRPDKLDPPSASSNLADAPPPDAPSSDAPPPSVFDWPSKADPAPELSTSPSDISVDTVQPIAYAPKNLRVPAWSEAVLWVRVPHVGVAGSPIALLPLEDARADELGVLMAPALVQPDQYGMVPMRVINPSTKPVMIPLLTPVARFMVDPKVSGADVKFSVEEIMKKCHIDDVSSEADLQLIRRMISKRRRLFSDTLGVAHGYKLTIDTPLVDSGKVPPPSVPWRKRSPEEYAALKDEVDKQLKAGLLTKVRSPFNAMPLLVDKPSGGKRLVLDYRNLNSVCVKDTYPLPNIEENLSKLGRANLFTIADLLQGFHQIEIDASDGSVEKTAFSAPQGQVAYVRMPMGLTSSPGAFMRLVDAALRGLPAGIALAFVDDLICPTEGDMEQHMKDVGLVFDALIEAGLTVKCEKVHIGKKEVPHLGFFVGAYGTRPDPDKIAPLLAMTRQALKSDAAAAGRFAGMVQFYSRFIEGCHHMMAPFHKLKQKGIAAKDAMFTLKFDASFAALKHALTSITANQRPDFHKPFYVDVDTAVTGSTASSLSQRDDPDDGDSHRPLGFHSQQLNDNERGYGVQELECLGLVRALRQWRSYLHGSEVIVRTDHKSLKWLLSSHHRAGSRVGEWAVEVAPYDPTIEYVPGKLNVVPDCISRAFSARSASEEEMGSCTITLTPKPYSNEDSFSFCIRAPRQFLEEMMQPDSTSAHSAHASGEGLKKGGGQPGVPAVKPHEEAPQEIDSECSACLEDMVRSLEDLTDYPLHKGPEAGLGLCRSNPRPTLLTSGELGPEFGAKFLQLVEHSLIHNREVTLELPGVRALRVRFTPHKPLKEKAWSVASVTEATHFSGDRFTELVKLQLLRAVTMDGLSPEDTVALERLLSELPRAGTLRLVGVASECTLEQGRVFTFDLMLPASDVLGRAILLGTRAGPDVAPVDGVVVRGLFIQKHGESHRVLMEWQDGTLQLPAVLADGRGPCYRAQLAESVRSLLVGESATMVSTSLDAATRWRFKREGTSNITFVGVLPSQNGSSSDQPPILCDAAPARVDLIELTASLAFGVSNSVDRWVLDSAFRRLSPLVDTTAKKPLAFLPYLLRDSDLQRVASAATGGTGVEPETNSVAMAALAAVMDRTGQACLTESQQIPSVRDPGFENGPALVDCWDDGVLAVRSLLRAVQGDESASISVDLEGFLSGSRYKPPSICLVQVCVTPEDGLPTACFVFDAFVAPVLLQRSGPDSLRDLLQNSNPKVLHCCYGDASSLHIQFGIELTSVFDTSVADSLLMGRHFNSPRDLGTVLLHHLGEQAVHLTHKGKLVFFDRMFEQRPLPPHLFVYSYEDVLFCNELYRTMRAALLERDLMSLTMALSIQRCPPISVENGRELPISLALVDADSVLCLESPAGEAYLPTGAALADSSRESIKAFAREHWVREMGLPPKGVASAIHARLQVPTKLGRTWLLTARVSSCEALLDAIRVARTEAGLDGDVRVRAIDSCSSSAVESQAAAFQFLSSEYRRARNRKGSARLSQFCSTHAPAPASATASSASAFVVTGPVHTNWRAAVILHGKDFSQLPLQWAPTSGPLDAAAVKLESAALVSALEGSLSFSPATWRDLLWLHGSCFEVRPHHVIWVPSRNTYLQPTGDVGRCFFSLFSPNTTPSFPSYHIEVGASGRSAAVRALDLWLGPAARLGGAEGSPPSKFWLCPMLSSQLRVSLDQLTYVGTFGHTFYYGCELIELEVLRSAVWASRNPTNGFRLTPTLSKKYPTADVVNHSWVPKLEVQDTSAWKSMVSVQSGAEPPREPRVPQHSEKLEVFEEPTGDVLVQRDAESPSGPRLPQHSDKPETAEGKVGNVTAADDSPPDTSLLPPLAAARATHLSATELELEERDATALMASSWAALGFGVTFPTAVSPRADGIAHVFSASALEEADLAPGEDVEVDTLLEASALVHMALHCPAWSSSSNSSSSSFAVKNSLPAGDDADAAGLPPSYRVPTVADLKEAQERHPGTLQFLIALGADVTDWGGPKPLVPQEGDPDFPRFQKVLASYCLNSDGLLCYSAVRVRKGEGGTAIEDASSRGKHRRIVLPPKFQTYAMACYHDRQGHLGVRKGFPALARRFYWGTVGEMQQAFSTYIGDCRPCTRCKLAKHKHGPGAIASHGEHPFDIVSADYYKVGRVSRKGSQVDVTVEAGAPNLESDSAEDDLPDSNEPGYDGTVSFGCQFSRMIKVVGVRGTPSSQTICRLLVQEVIRHYGTPRALRSDHGSNFVAKAVKALYRHFGIRMEASAPYHHRTIGLVERWHSVLRTLIMTHYNVSGDERWHLYLPWMEMAFNQSINTATGYSPFFVVNLRHPPPMDGFVTATDLATDLADRTLPDWVKEYLAVRGVTYDAVAQKLSLNALHRLRQFNLKRDADVHFPVGTSVLITKGRAVDHNLPKAEEPTEGPFTIERYLGNGNYSISDRKSRRIKNTFHAERLVRFPTRRTIAQCELSDWYPVKAIVGRRIGTASSGESEIQYRIEWVGFGSSQRTWLSMDYLVDIAPMVAQYNSLYPLPTGFAPPTLERESRDAPPTPEIEPDAGYRPHFRHRPAVADAPPHSPSPPAEAVVPIESTVEPTPESTPSWSAPETLADLSPGSVVEVFFPEASSALGGGRDVWISASVIRSRVQPGRRGEPPRSTLMVSFDTQRSSRPKEFSFPLGESATHSIRIPPLAATAATDGAAPLWVRCNHGMVLLGDDNPLLEFPGFSATRCRRAECCRNCSTWISAVREADSGTGCWAAYLGTGATSAVLY